MGSIDATTELDRSCREICKCACRPFGLFDPEERTYRDSSRHPYCRHVDASEATACLGRGSILAGLGTSTKEAFDATGSEVIERLITGLGSINRELLLVIFLDQQGRYIFDDIVASGDNRAVRGRFRSIIAKALANETTGVILVHNHPSGSLIPSVEDLQFTRELAALCRPLDLVLIDHLIVTNEHALSLRKAKLT